VRTRGDLIDIDASWKQKIQREVDETSNRYEPSFIRNISTPKTPAPNKDLTALSATFLARSSKLASLLLRGAKTR